jgi:hypothetical protein
MSWCKGFSYRLDLTIMATRLFRLTCLRRKDPLHELPGTQLTGLDEAMSVLTLS